MVRIYYLFFVLCLGWQVAAESLPDMVSRRWPGLASERVALIVEFFQAVRKHLADELTDTEFHQLCKLEIEGWSELRGDSIGGLPKLFRDEARIERLAKAFREYPGEERIRQLVFPVARSVHRAAMKVVWDWVEAATLLYAPKPSQFGLGAVYLVYDKVIDDAGGWYPPMREVFEANGATDRSGFIWDFFRMGQRARLTDFERKYGDYHLHDALQPKEAGFILERYVRLGNSDDIAGVTKSITEDLIGRPSVAEIEHRVMSIYVGIRGAIFGVREKEGLFEQSFEDWSQNEFLVLIDENGFVQGD